MKILTLPSRLIPLTAVIVISVLVILGWWIVSAPSDKSMLNENSARSSKISRTVTNVSSGSDNKVTQAGKYRIQVQVEPNPPIAGKNKLTVIVKDEKGQLVTGAKVRAVAQMPAMDNMEAMNAPANIRETATGIYSGEFELGMRGEWPLAVDVESETLGHADLVLT